MSRLLVRTKRIKKQTLNTKGKTHSSMKKRFSISKNNKIFLSQSGKRHNMSQKTKFGLRSAKGRKIANNSLTKLVRNAMRLKVLKRQYKTMESCTKNIVILDKKVKKLLFC